MAKAPNKPAAASTPYPLRTVSEVPAPAAFGRGGADDAIMQTMKAMPAPANGQFNAFTLEAAAVDANITDPNERAKGLKDNVRKLMSNLSARGKRIGKTVPGATFAIRRGEKEGTVDVYRTA